MTTTRGPDRARSTSRLEAEPLSEDRITEIIEELPEPARCSRARRHAPTRLARSQLSMVTRRFFHHKMAVVSLVLMLVIISCASGRAWWPPTASSSRTRWRPRRPEPPLAPARHRRAGPGLLHVLLKSGQSR